MLRCVDGHADMPAIGRGNLTEIGAPEGVVDRLPLLGLNALPSYQEGIAVAQRRYGAYSSRRTRRMRHAG